MSFSCTNVQDARLFVVLDIIRFFPNNSIIRFELTSSFIYLFDKRVFLFCCQCTRPEVTSTRAPAPADLPSFSLFIISLSNSVSFVYTLVITRFLHSVDSTTADWRWRLRTPLSYLVNKYCQLLFLQFFTSKKDSQSSKMLMLYFGFQWCPSAQRILLAHKCKSFSLRTRFSTFHYLTTCYFFCQQVFIFYNLLTLFFI